MLSNDLLLPFHSSMASATRCYTPTMTRHILTTLALLLLTAAVSAGLLHAQGSAEAERAPYRIDLHPGWNLISFPGDPVDTTLENVIGSDSPVNIILAYQNEWPGPASSLYPKSSKWLVAVRSTEGTWQGTLTELSGVRGYWMHATDAGVIEAVLSTDTPRPSSEGCGWQLMGVWDAEQRPLGTEIDADAYFNEISWRAAYGYLTNENRWTKQVANSNGIVETGAGYWVWISISHAHTPDSVHYFCRLG